MSIEEAVVEDVDEIEVRSSAAGANDLETDDLFHILQARRRRDVLRYLRRVDRSVELGELAEEVAAGEQDTAVEALTSSERRRVYISLYQTHLPKLAREGVVEYDRNRGVVERTALAAAFDPYIDAVDGSPRPSPSPSPSSSPWPYRYAATACGGGLVLAALAAAGTISPTGFAAGAAVVAAFVAVAGAHAAASR